MGDKKDAEGRKRKPVSMSLSRTEVDALDQLVEITGETRSIAVGKAIKNRLISKIPFLDQIKNLRD